MKPNKFIHVIWHVILTRKQNFRYLNVKMILRSMHTPCDLISSFFIQCLSCSCFITQMNKIENCVQSYKICWVQRVRSRKLQRVWSRKLQRVKSRKLQRIWSSKLQRIWSRKLWQLPSLEWLGNRWKQY